MGLNSECHSSLGKVLGPWTCSMFREPWANVSGKRDVSDFESLQGYVNQIRGLPTITKPLKSLNFIIQPRP